LDEKKNLSLDEQVALLMYGSEYGDEQLRTVMTQELRLRLAESAKEGRPLRVYAGYDPTAPDLHIGHSITLRRLRLFQELGHEVYFVVGTFTAQVGDTSDKATGRPRRSQEEVDAAARSYAEQCYRLLDRERTKVVYNGDWLSKLTFADVTHLASCFTVQQFLARENYRKRIDEGNPVALHEFLYALMQGYDAVHLRADVQLGAKEQLFNILAGRKLQETFGQKPCICITFPILVGTDGRERMSKSKGNYVGINEPAGEQFGKVMSISDETMVEWAKYTTRWTPAVIDQHLADLREGRVHPMAWKKMLAEEIVALYHGEEQAAQGRETFEAVHQRRQRPTDAPEVALAGPTLITDVLVQAGAASSKSEARRLIAGRGVRLDGRVIESHGETVAGGGLLQVGSHRAYRLTVAAS
jgi:tyrosyl-tRNA synthetase